MLHIFIFERRSGTLFINLFSYKSLMSHVIITKLVLAILPQINVTLHPHKDYHQTIFLLQGCQIGPTPVCSEFIPDLILILWQVKYI